MQTLFITGGCGFIGSNFINYFAKKNPDINIINFDALYYCADENNILEEIKESKNYNFIKGNLNNFDLLKTIFENNNITHVIHFAAQSHVQNSFNESIKYTLDTLSMQYGFTWGISNNKFTAISDILSPKNTFLISNSNKNLINDYPSFYSASQVARSIQIDTILDARLQPFSGVRIKESINQNLIDGSLQTGTSNGNTQKTNDKGTFRINYISHNGDTHGGNYNTRLECFVYANEGQGDIVQ